MARIRTIKPEFWQDEKLAPCDPLTRLVFLGLIGMADDAGRLLDNVKVIDAFIFSETPETCRESLAVLASLGRIRRGVTASGQRVIEIVNWHAHQKIERPNFRGALPELVGQVPTEQALPTHSPTPHRRFGEASVKPHRSVGEESSNHTNDLGPVPTTSTNDQGAPRSRSAPVERSAKKYPHFSQDDRGRVLAAFRKVGAFEPSRIIKAVGPLFRPPDDPAHVPHDRLCFAVEEYCGVILKGRSAPFAGPEDCAKRVLGIAQACETHYHDPLARCDAVLMAIHGSTRLAA